MQNTAVNPKFAESLGRIKQKHSAVELRHLVTEVLNLCGEINLPIPTDEQPYYLNAKTTHEYYIKAALEDSVAAFECFSQLKQELTKQ